MPDNDKNPTIECGFDNLAIASYFMSNGMVCVKVSDKEYDRIDTSREEVKRMDITDDKYPIKGNIQPININPSFIRVDVQLEDEEEDASTEDLHKGG